eukprot:scpid112639/ scgid13372/ 
MKSAAALTVVGMAAATEVEKVQGGHPQTVEDPCCALPSAFAPKAPTKKWACGSLRRKVQRQIRRCERYDNFFYNKLDANNHHWPEQRDLLNIDRAGDRIQDFFKAICDGNESDDEPDSDD